MSQLSRGGLVKSAVVFLALLASSFAPAAVARSHTEAEALSPPNCGSAGGSLADPAETQRCLAERYKPPKPKSAPARSDAAPASGASHDPLAVGAPPSNTMTPAHQGS